MRSMCAAALALTVGLILAFADDKKPAGSNESRAEQLKSIISKYEKGRTELKKRLDMTRDPTEKQGIVAEMREDTIIAAQDALKLVEEDPTDATAFEVVVFVVEKAGPYGADKETATVAKVVAEHHLNNPKVKDLLPKMAMAGPVGQKFMQTTDGQKFLQTAAEKSTDKSVKGLAFFFLGLSASGKLEEEDDAKTIEELLAKARDCFKKAEAEAPDAKVGTTTVGKAVAEQLDALKAVKAIAIGKAVPDEIEGTNLDGKQVKLTSYKGKVVLLDIWATWCGPCRAMIPHEREMVMKLKGKPFVLLSVSCDDEQDTLIKFFEKEKMPWDHWFDGQRGTVAKAFRIRAFPTLYLIDHSGVIRNKWIGNPGDEKLEHAIEHWVNEAVKAKG